MHPTSLWRALPMMAVVLALGCGKPNGPAAPTASAPAEDHRDREAEVLLDSVRGILQTNPGNPAVYPSVLKQLNQYLGRRSDAVPVLDPGLRQLVVQVLGPAEAQHAERKTFDAEDADYIGTALFLEAIARARRTEGDDVAYARQLFDWTCRYVQLQPLGTLPEGRPREVCIRGVGNVNERAWIFLELLRQAGIPGCMVALRQTKGASEDILPWLCGVVQGTEIYLFEPELGVPVPSKQRPVATLAELLKDPQLVAGFQVEAALPPYRVKPEQIRQVSLLLILEAPMVAPRMHFLQDRLAGAASRPNLYLDFPALQAKAMACASALGGAADVRIWQYPQLVGKRLRESPQALIELYESMNMIWLRDPRSPRLMQFLGEHENAIKRFVNFDQEMTPEILNALLASQGVPADLRRRIVSQTHPDLTYFVGLSKLDQARPEPEYAREWFNRYLERYNAATLAADEIVDWGAFCNRLGSDGAAEKPTPAKRLWECLSADARAAVEQVRQVYQSTIALRNEFLLKRQELQLRRAEADESGGSPQLNQAIDELQNDLRMRAEALDKATRVEDALKSKIVTAVNAALARRDFYQPQAFADIVKANAEVQSMVKTKPEAMSDREVLLLNRQLVDLAFPNEITLRQSMWAAGAVRNRAVAFHREGRLDDAIASLRSGVKEVPPTQRPGLLALMQSWERQAKASGRPGS